MADKIQFRRDTAARWQQFNPILMEGEVGYVLDDPNQYKIGDGSTPWNSLPLRGFDGTLVHSTGDSTISVMSQKAVTEELQDLKREADSGQFGYAKDCFINGSTGKVSTFKGLCILSIPYKSGDVVEVVGATDPDGPTGSNHRYNFYTGDTYLGGGDTLDDIPEGTDTIKINSNYSSGNGIECVTINGKAYNIRSMVYLLDNEVSSNAEAIAQNTEAIADTDRKLDDINKQLYTEYTSLITDYGTNTCIQNWSGYVTISYENGKYKVVVTNNTGGTFIAKSTNIDESLLTAGRRIAYFVDVEFVKFPAEQATWSFGAINDVGRKTVNAAQGQRMRSVFKAELTEETAVANKCGLFLVLAFSAALNEDWEYLYHAFGIIDCGTDNSNPLYNLGEDEILALLAEGTYAEDSKIAAPKVLEVEGLKNANGTFTFRDKEDNTLAVLDGTGLRVKDVKSLESKDLFLRRKLQGKEFFTVGDSLCSAGSWQPMFAELTGGVFDKAYNKDNISIGGTTSLGASAYSGQNRLKKLIEEKVA